MFKRFVSAANSSMFAEAIALLGGLAIAFPHNSALAQISPDETLGVERSVITPNVEIKGAAADQIDGGAIRGSNLFHSFREFNIGDGQRVYFSNPSGINNILGRVTGNNPSDILGTLGVNGNANLFLINPNGIIFGKNASLDVGKSFYATTANSIKFGELGEFNATNPQSPSPLLTINPSAFFFNVGTNPGSIINQSRATQTLQGTPTDGLQVPNGQTLLLLGGNVTIDDGRLIARGGRVEIGAVAGTGSVGLNANGSLSFPDTIQRADVVFNNQALADVTFANAGDIGVTARNIDVLQGSGLLAGIQTGLGTVDSQAGDITLNATGEVRLTASLSRIENNVSPNAIGKGGNVKITANSLVLSNRGQIRARTLGVGNAGNIVITTERTYFNNSDASSRVEETGRGNSGNLQITTDTLEVTNLSQLSASTLGIGDAGNVIITANRASIIDSDILSRVGRTARGKGGNVQITANILEVINGGGLITNVIGIGDAGNIIINARDRVLFSGQSADGQFTAGAFSEVFLPNARGNGGNIQITTKTLEVTNGGELFAGTSGVGNAGNIIILADNILFSGISPSGIASGAFTFVSKTGNGKGGNLQISAKNLEVTNGALMSAYTDGIGDAGNVQISTNTLEVTNGAQLIAATFGTGDAGNILINATKTVNIAGTTPQTRRSGIFVRSQASGGAGEISINAPTIQLNQGTLSAESATVNGGNITLNPQNILLLRNHSLISATAGTAQQNGDGGNITINAPKGFIVASPNENSDITANAFNGAGGKIQINATGIFGIAPLSRQDLQRLRPLDLNPRQLSTSDITAVSQQNPSLSGSVQINTPDTDPSQSLVQLPTNLVDVSQQIASGCTPSSQQSQSSFIATGRGGLPLSPTQPLQDTSMLSDWVRVGEQPATSSQVQLTPLLAKSATPIVEAQGWVVDANGGIVLVAQTPQTNPRDSWQAPVSCPAF